MVRMHGTYLGNKKVEIKHEPSGVTIVTAAPLDNNGDGSSFSPTDLTAAALGSCMLTVMAIVGERHALDLVGASYDVEKHMTTNPRRIGFLPINMHLPAGLSEQQRRLLENAAKQCPVHATLSADVDVKVSFIYDV